MADAMRIVVTGATGFIGAAVAEHFSGRGHDVLALARRPLAGTGRGIRWARYALEESPARGTFEGAHAIVHCAYAPGDVALNVAAAARLLDASRAAGVRRNVFLSSLSAREGSPSAYARQKLAVERLFASTRDTVLRAGLVVGSGGLFARMREHVRAGRPIPVIGRGDQPIQVIGIDDLVRAVDAVIGRDLAGALVVAHPDAVPYRQFHEALARRAGVRARFVRVPFHLLNVALWTAEVVGLPLPVQRDSLLGLRAMTRTDPREHLERLALEAKGFAELLEELPP